jgi:hypothetical protein
MILQEEILILLAKLGVGLLTVLSYVIVAQQDYLADLSNRLFHAFISFVWLVTRPGLFVLVFLLLRMDVVSDVVGGYYPEGHHVMAGETVYRDFDCPYAPAFPYLIQAILRIDDSPKAIVFTSILTEGIALFLWSSAIRRAWDLRTYRRMTLLYVFSVLIIIDVALAGQNQIWVASLLGAAVYFVTRDRRLLSAFAAGLPVVLVKILPLIYLPAILKFRCKGLYTAAVALALPVCVYAVLLANGINALQPLKLQGSLITSGTLPYLLTAVIPQDGAFALLSRAIPFGALLVLSAYFFFRGGELTARQVVFRLAIITLAVPLVSPKFSTNYMVMAFFPICAIAASEVPGVRSALFFGLFNLVAALEPSLWFRWLHGEEHYSRLPEVWTRVQRTGDVPFLWLFLALELVLIAQYVYYLRAAFRMLHESEIKP